MGTYSTRAKDPRFYGLLFCLLVCVRTALVYLPPVKTAINLPGGLGNVSTPRLLVLFALAWFAAALGCLFSAATAKRTPLLIALPAGPAFLSAAAYMVGAPFAPHSLSDLWTGVLFFCIAGFIVCWGLVKPLEPRAHTEGNNG